MFKKNICIFIILISILSFAESSDKMRLITTPFSISISEGKAEKQNKFITTTTTKEDKKDIIMGYGGFLLSDRNKFLGVGISLITVGMSTFLSGLISMVVLFNYYSDSEPSVIYTDPDGNFEDQEITRTSYRNIATMVGSIFIPLGTIISILSIIPFSIAGYINALYNKRKKENSEKLTFFDRMNLNVGFVMKSNVFREYESKLDLSMSISL